MSHTKKLLEAGSLMDYIDDIKVEKKSFVNDKGETLEYNSFIIVFANGDEVQMRQEPKWLNDLKTAVYYCDMQLSTK